jgi:hypothetical protein
MEEKILAELQQIKQLALLAAKQALAVTDASLFTGLGKSRIYKPVCTKKYRTARGREENSPTETGLRRGNRNTGLKPAMKWKQKRQRKGGGKHAVQLPSENGTLPKR